MSEFETIEGVLGYRFRGYGRGARIWSVEPYADNMLQRYPDIVRAGCRPAVPVREPLRPGDLVKVFKSVSDGDLLWQGVIDLDYNQRVSLWFRCNGVQESFDAARWGAMFLSALPACLERDGRKIYGALEAFYETGTEGILWSLHEYGVSSYPGLHVLKKGDALSVYSAVRDGDVAWQGTLVPDVTADPAIDGSVDVVVPPDMDAETWETMVLTSQPVIVQRPVQP